MEVHHHPHLHHQVKPWKEYLLEGFMIFIAVSMGFIAESIREHQVLNHKKEQNLTSIIIDLKKDSVELQKKLIEYSQSHLIFNKLSNFSFMYHQNKLNEDAYIDSVVNQIDSLTFGSSFYQNNSSYKNTISNGSFSNINSSEAKIKLSEYYEAFSTQLADNNLILDQIEEWYTANVFFRRYYNLTKGGRRRESYLMNNKVAVEETENSVAMRNYYIKNREFRMPLLSNKFIIDNEKVNTRCIIYLGLLEKFVAKNKELIALLSEKEKSHL
jgi:hypothetical protein